MEDITDFISRLWFLSPIAKEELREHFRGSPTKTYLPVGEIQRIVVDWFSEIDNKRW